MIFGGIVLALCAVAGAAAPASASIYFTFDDPDTSLEAAGRLERIEQALPNGV